MSLLGPPNLPLQQLIMTSIMTKPEIYAAFPEPVSLLTGKPDVRELIRILQQLILCAQYCKAPLSLQIVLFLTLPENILIVNTREKYPVLPNPPPPIANYNRSIDASDRATTKEEWELSKKTFDECINMNSALVTRFLSFINPTFKTYDELIQLSNPNAPFLNVLIYLCENTREAMSRTGHTIIY